MKMLLQCLLALELLVACEAVADDRVFEIMGNLNIAYDWYNGSFQELVKDDWRSYSSKLGFVGHLHLSKNTELVYELEQNVYPIHGGTRISEFTQLSKAIVGVKGRLGTALFGTYDTPFKMAQVGIDLFSDQGGDIRTLVSGEVTAHDSYMFYSPRWEGWQMRVMYVPKDNDFSSSTSMSVVYESDELHLGFAIDESMRRNNLPVEFTYVHDAYRVAARYTPEHWSFGLLYERSKRQGELAEGWASAFVGSVRYKLGKVAFLAQYGRSNVVGNNTKSTNLGLEYHFSNSIKTYLYHWEYDNTVHLDTVSLGLKITF